MKIHSAAAMLCATAGLACAQSGVIPHEFTIRLARGQEIQDVAEDYHAIVVASYSAKRLYLLRTIDRSEEDSVEDGVTETELEHDGRLDFSDQNRENAIAGGHTQSFFVSVVPSDFFDQPAWRWIGLPPGGGDCAGQDVSIAVLDTGVFLHSSFAPRVRTDGTSFVDSEPAASEPASGLDSNGNGVPDEFAGHGTYVTGLINHIAPCSSILPVRVLDSDGVGSSFTIAAGIYYALDHGAKVINLSLTSPFDSLTVREALAAAKRANAVVVCASGNEGTGVPQYPAANAGVVAVAAVDSADQLTPWSNFGLYVRFAAPGVNVVSTFPGNQFVSASGTSASAAFVSGALARAISRSPGAPSNTLIKNLALTSRTIDSMNPGLEGQVGRALYFGYGTSKPPTNALIAP